MQWVIIGIIAARPGSILIRVSRAIVVSAPNTKPASRVFGSRARAASLSASSTARAVSIIAHTVIQGICAQFSEQRSNRGEIVDG